MTIFKNYSETICKTVHTEALTSLMKVLVFKAIPMEMFSALTRICIPHAIFQWLESCIKPSIGFLQSQTQLCVIKAEFLKQKSQLPVLRI